MRRSAIIAVVWAITTAAGAAGGAGSPSTAPADGKTAASGVCRLIEEMIQEGKVAGAQVVVGDAKSLLLVRSFGVRSLADRKPVDDETLFCIGSCSKMFAAAVVMTLVAEGKLDLDAPIDRWLKEFSSPRSKGGVPAARAPTLRELLCHRAGIYSQKNRMTRSQTRWIRDFRLTLAESVKGIAAERLIAEPGKRFAYSGAGYCVLGRVAEVAAAAPFDELLSRRICKPLGLGATTYFPPAGHKNAAAGHLVRSGKLVVASSTPHLLGTKHKLALIGGSIYCPAREAARFAQMLLNEGKAEGRAVLTGSAWKEMTAPHATRDGGGYGFGLCVVTDAKSGRPRMLSHGGALSGSYSYVVVDLRTRRFGVVNYTGRRSKVAVGAALRAWVSPPPENAEAVSRGPKRGALFISGGGNKSPEAVDYPKKVRFPAFVDLVRRTGAAKTPRIVVITTAGGRMSQTESEGKEAVLILRKLVGKANITVLNTLSRKVADSDEFTAPIDAADAVWMTGGKQVHLAKTFLGTGTEKALRRLLDRGGVIGGSSAGAQIQSSFMTRGTLGKAKILGDGVHQRGFGFITNTAFDVHVAARRRKNALFTLFAAEPGQLADPDLDPRKLLGIGIDELTAILVRQDQFEVIGKGHVYVFNPREWSSDTQPFYHTLSAGDRYDIRERKRLPSTGSRPRTQPAPSVRVGPGEPQAGLR